MNLTARVRYSCQDIRKLKPSKEYDVVASLGLGVAQIYGSHSDALELSKTMLGKNGVLILAEPVWLSRPVSPETLEALGETADDFLTEPEMQRLMRKSGFEELGSFASSKIDWEIYVRPVYLAVQEIIQAKSKLAEEAQRVIDGFRAEYDAVGCDWNMAVGVVRSL